MPTVYRVALLIVTGAALVYLIDSLRHDDDWLGFLVAAAVFGVGAWFVGLRDLRERLKLSHAERLHRQQQLHPNYKHFVYAACGMACLMFIRSFIDNAQISNFLLTIGVLVFGSYTTWAFLSTKRRAERGGDREV